MKVLLLMFMIFSSFCSLAAKEYITNTKDELNIPIARKGLTRVAFERDRVSRVIGNEEEYQIEGDHDTGQIFISPKIAGKIHITIMTEKGLVQDINFIPEDDLAAETVFLKERILSSKLDIADDKSGIKSQSERSKIISILREIINSDQNLNSGDVYEKGYFKREIDYRILSSEFECVGAVNVDHEQKFYRYEGKEFYVYVLEGDDSAAEQFIECNEVYAVSVSNGRLYLLKRVYA